MWNVSLVGDSLYTFVIMLNRAPKKQQRETHLTQYLIVPLRKYATSPHALPPRFRLPSKQTYHACYKRKESKIRSPCVYIQIIRNSARPSICSRSQCASSTHDCICKLAYLYCVSACSLGIQVPYQRCLRRIGLTFSRLEFVD